MRKFDTSRRFIYLVIAIFLLSYNMASAQNAGCNFSIDTSRWYTGTSYSVAWNPAGNKVLVASNGNTSPGFFNTNLDHTVANVTDTSQYLSINAAMTVNTGGADYYGADIFTPNGGAIYGGSDGYTSSRYQKPAGGFTALAPLLGASAVVTQGYGVSIDRDTTVFYVYNSSTGAYSVGYLNDSDPQNPVAGILPISVNLFITGGPRGSNLATMGNRIYYERLPAGDNPNLPRVIKCVDFGGAVCPNWTDVTLSTGGAADIQIRPTDSLIFVRTTYRDFTSGSLQFPEPGGVVIFDKNGVLATGFNFTDLSIMAQSGKENFANIIRFDGAGNIFANIGTSSTNVGATEPAAQIGIMKFDSKGNMDLDFHRNMLNSYSAAKWSYSTYFDVNKVTGMIVSSMAFSLTVGANHALLGGNYTQGNNVLWYQNFPDNGIGAGSAPPPGGYNTLYNTVHFFYNNGKLKIKGETLSTKTANCGTQTPTVVPVTATAAGILQCANLSFITAPTFGTASTLVMKVPINVTTAGTFKNITVTGSGLTMQDPSMIFNATQTGNNDFYVTLKYNGTTALGNVTITVPGVGNCTVDLSDQTKNNPSIINIWTPENCTYKVIGPVLH